MSLPSLEYIKESIVVEDDGNDVVLLELRDSAVAYLQAIGVEFDPNDCPKPIAQAITVYVKHFFDFGRSIPWEDANPAKMRVPWAVVQLVAPYREVCL